MCNHRGDDLCIFFSVVLCPDKSCCCEPLLSRGGQHLGGTLNFPVISFYKFLLIICEILNNGNIATIRDKQGNMLKQTDDHTGKQSNSLFKFFKPLWSFGLSSGFAHNLSDHLLLSQQLLWWELSPGPVFTKTFILTLGVLPNLTKSFYVGVVS